MKTKYEDFLKLTKKKDELQKEYEKEQKKVDSQREKMMDEMANIITKYKIENEQIFVDHLNLRQKTYIGWEFGGYSEDLIEEIYYDDHGFKGTFSFRDQNDEGSFNELSDENFFQIYKYITGDGFASKFEAEKMGLL